MQPINYEAFDVARVIRLLPRRFALGSLAKLPTDGTKSPKFAERRLGAP
jgi:hypothetical protein